MKPLILVLTTLIAVPSIAMGQEMSTPQQKYSYTVGFNVGQNIKRTNVEIDVDAFTQAIRDVLTGGDLKMTEDEMQAVLAEERRKLAEVQQALSLKNKQAGEDFLAENLKREEVKQTDSGLQYEIVREGTGAKPTINDMVVVHYRGTLVDGTEFDSSYNRNAPATFPVSGVIKGWQEGIQMMRTGAKWKLYVPSALAYGEKGAGGPIGPHQALIFEVELQEIK